MQGGYGLGILTHRGVVVSVFFVHDFEIKLVPGTKFRVGVYIFSHLPFLSKYWVLIFQIFVYSVSIWNIISLSCPEGH